MFELACIVSIFFLLFFVKRTPYTFWMFLFFLAVLLLGRKNLTTYDIKWNLSFVLFFLASLFIFRVIKQNMNFWLFLLIGVYGVIELLSLRYAEWIRIDLSLLCGCSLFFLSWLFERDLRAAFCLSVCSLFLAVFLFGFGQFIFGEMQQVDIGTTTHLNEIGWMILAFIFFSLCERIQMIEKNYG